MPPKPQVFKAPDGKEFTSKAEWRDYMMATFYSFKNRNNEPEPLMKLPGSIEGQMFDIADCSNSTLLVLDHTEQIQIDNIVNCRVFIGACASSIFIRNCSNCKFFTCCRQLRLRDVVDCDFYIYSMAEVHIEYSTRVRFAPFNGAYPEHGAHMKAANLDVQHNLWYDVYDHNDPHKSKVNWSLIPEAEYEAPWFPLGVCDMAIPRNQPGSVELPKPDSSMQAFSIQQMIADSKKLELGSSANVGMTTTATSSPKPAAGSDEALIGSIIARFCQFRAGESLEGVSAENFQVVLSNGALVNRADFEASAPVVPELTFDSLTFHSISESKDFATAIAKTVSTTGQVKHMTFGLAKKSGEWKLQHAHRS